MKIYIKNKIISMGGSSTAKNEKGEDIFFIKGKWVLFSPTRKKKIYDKNKNLLYIVRNKWWNFIHHRAFIYDSNKEKIATLRREIFSNKTQFILEGYKDEISLDGNFFAWDLQVKKGNEIIGTIKRNFDLLRGSFELEADEENIAFLTSIVIAIDNIYDKAGSNH